VWRNVRNTSGTEEEEEEERNDTTTNHKKSGCVLLTGNQFSVSQAKLFGKDPSRDTHRESCLMSHRRCNTYKE